MQFIVLFLILITFLLIGLSSFLLFYYVKINKAINLFLEKGKVRDAREILFSHIEKTKKLEIQLEKIANRIQSLEKVSKISLQKIAIVRFNPFGDIGGNQSFAIAMLDSQNNGFVVSSLFIQEGNRVYAKSITNGVSEYSLSQEEQEAIRRAIKIKN